MSELARPLGGPGGPSYQLVQSLYAISSGGVFGSGLGNGGLVLPPDGNPYIPFLETDFIFSAIAQELGLAGAAGVILLYLIFAYRGFRISMLAAGRLLEAARRRAHGRRLRPGVHHHRRSHRADPADGDHASVRLLRRVEHRRQLRRPRAPAHGLRPREPGASAREPADPPPLLRLLVPVRRPHRHDDLLALARARPGGAAGEPDADRPRARDQARAHPRGRRAHAARGEPEARARGRTRLVAPPLSARLADRARRRLLDDRPLADRASSSP